MLKFNRRFTEDDMDRQLEEKLANELSGIFNWVGRLHETQKKRNSPWANLHPMKMSKNEYRDEVNSDSISLFEKKYFIKSINPSDVIIFNAAYESYKKYCQNEERARFAGSKATLRRCLLTWAIK